MSLTTTLESRTDSRWPELRARILHDADAMQPDDDAGSPVITLRYTARGWRAEILGATNAYWPEYQAALNAAERWGGDFDMLERYLRLYHGATGIDYMSDRAGTVYIASDPAVWRDKLGAPEGADLGDWRDYITGEVFGVVVERLVTWAEVGGDRTMQTWDQEDSIWGLYGWSYALTTCDDMLHDAGAAKDARDVELTVLA